MQLMGGEGDEKTIWWRVSFLVQWGELRQMNMVKITQQSTNMIENKGECGEGDRNSVKELDYDQIMINPVATKMHFTVAVKRGLSRIKNVG